MDAAVTTRSETQDGAVATEFALIAPLLILLFFGIVYFGLTIFRQQTVESATREAAREMAVGGTVDQIEAALDASSPGFLDSELNIQSFTRTSRTGVVTTPSLAGGDQPCNGTTEFATVVTRADVDRFDFTVPFYGGGPVDAVFGATATFRCEV